MCRSIKPLYNLQPPVSDDEVRAAARQFVRKISGYREPSQANREAFERGIDEVAHAAQHLLASLTTKAPPRPREQAVATQL